MGDLVTLLAMGGVWLGVTAWQKVRAIRNPTRSPIEQAHAARGGTLIFKRALFVERDGAELKIEWNDRSEDTDTTFESTLAPPGLPTCWLLPNTLVNRMNKHFGAEPITTGDVTFDDVFIVRARDPVVATRVWSDARLRQLALRMPMMTLTIDGASYKMTHPLSDTADPIIFSIDLFFDLLGGDPYGAAILAKLSDARVAPGDDGLPVAELPGPSPVRVGPCRREEVVRTCVWTAVVGDVADDAETLVTNLGATLQVVDGDARIWFPGIETDLPQLTAAIEIARRLSSPSAHGVFR